METEECLGAFTIEKRHADREQTHETVKLIIVSCCFSVCRPMTYVQQREMMRERVEWKALARS